MANPVTCKRALSLLFFAAPLAWGQCQIDDFGDITNPQDPSCGGVRLTYTENDNSGDNIALGYPVPRPVASLTAVEGFRTYDSLHAQHQFLADDDDDVEALAIGQTLAGRTIWAYRLGDPDDRDADGRQEGAVLINGGIHAREWQSPEVLSALLEELVRINDDAGIGRYLADQVNVLLIPVLNIDGFLQTQRYPESVTALEAQPREGRMRRKNFRDPANSSQPIDEDIATIDDNFFGVDLNRNNTHGFGLNGGSSTSTSSLVYRAGAPASEPEIAALLAAAAAAPGDRLRLYSDVHSFSKIYLAPMTGNGRRNDITRDLSTRMRAVTNFSYRFAEDPPGSTIGTTADYFAVQFDIPSWTLELEPLSSGAEYGGTGASHSGFIVPDSEIARIRSELAQTLLLGIYRQAGPPALTAVHISDALSGATVFDAQWQAGVPRTLTITTQNALLPGVRYRVWLAFDKPMRWRDDSGAIANFPGQAAGTPAIALEAAGLFASDDGLVIAVDDSAWLDAPGGAPNGYRRYRDDALLVEFTLPADMPIQAPAPLALSVALSDMSQLQLDADPSSPADWSAGHWTGYEDAFGAEGDQGGADCVMPIFAAPANDPGAAPPADMVACKAAAPPAAPPPPQPPPAMPPASSGGGGAGWLLPVWLAALVLGRRRTR